MANQEQLEILKQGVDVWNKWREEYPDEEIDLTSADLIGAKFIRVNLSRANVREAWLNGANLSEANLHGVILRSAELREAYLSHANLSEAELREADLSHANLGGANLKGVNLSETNLTGAHLRQVTLSEANLSEANLSEANLSGANLSGAVLIGSNFLSAAVGGTVFGNSDLSEAIGLEDILHIGPSSISTDALVLSKGKIPEVFLRGCGLSDVDIEYAKLSNPDLSNEEINKVLYKIYDLRASQAVQISPLFISYSHADSTFVDKLESHLNQKGIRFWRDVHDARAGRLEKQIDRAMRLNPTVLLILSEHSIKSDWVEHEVRTARCAVSCCLG